MQGADRSLWGKLRRRLAKLAARRAAPRAPGRPMVSFCFDDAPESAALRGAEILEARGLTGTWFISMGLTGQDGPMGVNADAGQIGRLLEAGHEIGCHTFSHLNCGMAPAGIVAGDVERNLKALQAQGAPQPLTFAYPYGEVSAPAKVALGERFALARALHHGLIGEGSDLNQAPAVGIEGPAGEEVARRWLHRAIAEKAWLILYSHDVRAAPSPFGCTPAALARLADDALAGGAEVVTVAEGCRRIGVLT
jgi:peptidoglycan/xylan/chitin deacetylase (PgdA/CDA1 family)